MPFDFKKEYRDLYQPKTKPAIIEVPPMRFLAVEGTGDPNLQQVTQGLNVAYGQALKMVKAAADAMKYGPMDNWPDTKPLEAVAELHPVLWGTDWYERMLGQVLMPVNHPWYVLPTET